MFLTPLSTWFPEKNTEVAKNCQSSLKTEIEITCLHHPEKKHIASNRSMAI